MLASQFDPLPPLPTAVLTWADVTTSPTGKRCAVEQRLDEIFGRYPPASIEYRATAESADELRAAAGMIETLLKERR
jgi:hypothetical protein